VAALRSIRALARRWSGLALYGIARTTIRLLEPVSKSR
jgi:hypothetical protein